MGVATKLYSILILRWQEADTHLQRTFSVLHIIKSANGSKEITKINMS